LSTAPMKPGPVLFSLSLALAAGSACTTKEPTKTTYFARSISPILTTSCVRTNTGAGCHVADERGNALGNLDLASFAGIDTRSDLGADPARPDFVTFKNRVNPVLSGRSGDEATAKIACAASNCHGSLSNSLYLTCGETPEQIRWNYFAAQEYLGQTAELSEL